MKLTLEHAGVFERLSRSVFSTRQSVLSQDEDGRQFVVPSGHFLKLPDK